MGLRNKLYVADFTVSICAVDSYGRFSVSGQDCRLKSACNRTFFISVCRHVARIYLYICVCVHLTHFLPISVICTRGEAAKCIHILNVQTGIYHGCVCACFLCACHVLIWLL